MPIPLDEHPLLARYAAAHGADCVLYRGTVDRVAIDSYGRLWIVEYKTAKRAEHLPYQTDPQVTTYVWAM
ncbi:PD-(D/E)XK nuclease family protein, partial [Parvimonas micra]|uniref:PD-(D/E)XK nuclease family protein n=1 Tax=Parvimonas micra TaxID=33033 RepID=UPI003AFF61CB